MERQVGSGAEGRRSEVHAPAAVHTAGAKPTVHPLATPSQSSNTNHPE